MATALGDNPQDFYSAIGRALTVWTNVENEVCTLFCRCVGPKDGFPTHRAYWSVQSFEAKLRMVSAVMDARFGREKGIGKAWIQCRDELGKLNGWRNKIAHGTVVTMPYIDKRTKKKTNDLFLAPYFWGTLGQKSKLSIKDFRPSDRIYTDEIRKAAQNFSAMEDRVSELSSMVYEAVFGPEGGAETIEIEPA